MRDQELVNDRTRVGRCAFRKLDLRGPRVYLDVRLELRLLPRACYEPSLMFSSAPQCATLPNNVARCGRLTRSSLFFRFYQLANGGSRNVCNIIVMARLQRFGSFELKRTF